MTTTHTWLVRKLWFREVGNSPKVTQDTVGKNPGPSSFKACALFTVLPLPSQPWFSAGRVHFDPQGTFGNFGGIFSCHNWEWYCRSVGRVLGCFSAQEAPRTKSDLSQHVQSAKAENPGSRSSGRARIVSLCHF